MHMAAASGAGVATMLVRGTGTHQTHHCGHPGVDGWTSPLNAVFKLHHKHTATVILVCAVILRGR